MYFFGLVFILYKNLPKEEVRLYQEGKGRILNLSHVHGGAKNILSVHQVRENRFMDFSDISHKGLPCRKVRGQIFQKSYRFSENWENGPK